MTLTELRYVAVLAEEQHFGRAARVCHVSQPTLSIAVKKLERDLGAVLFERTRTGVRPTPLGEQVAARARRLLEQAAGIRDLVAADKDAVDGPIALGLLPTVGPYLLPQFIPLLQKLAPAMPLYIEEGDAGVLAGRLRGGELDAVVAALPFDEPEVVTQALFDEPFAVLMPAGHALAGKAAVAPEDLKPGEVLLLAEGHCFREQVLAALPQLRPQAAGGPGARPYEGGTLETLRHMVASGLGVAVLPMAAAQLPFYAPDLLVCRPFVDPAPRRTLALSWRVGFPRHKAIDILREAIQAASPAYWNYRTGPGRATAGVLVDNSEW